jgi:DNA (cytosine-5)-methyltransferase 1
MSALRLLDLFSGIGGFSLGLERSGFFRTVAFCEIEPFPRRVLKKHWPDVPIYEDVRTLNSAALRRDGIAIDAICGGFPCQDISVAGKGAGLAGERSGLWSEYARIIGELRPRIIIVENVAALLGRGLERVLGDLAALGFDAEWHCIPASAVGAPHRRDRLWIVANNAQWAWRSVEPSDQSGRRNNWPQEPLRGLGRHVAYADRAEWWPIGSPCDGLAQRTHSVFGGGQEGPGGLGADGQEMADAEGSGLERWSDGWDARSVIARSWQGGWTIGDQWLSEPDVGRVANGVPFELDLIGEIENGNCNCQETEPEAQAVVWELLRAMWQHREIAKTSSDIYRQRLYCSVPELPQGNPRSLWVLGPWIEKDKELRDLWVRFYAKPFHQAQDLQQGLLERIRTKKRPEALGSRVDRLRALGNAIVPQIPEQIGRAIAEAMS